MWILGGSHLSSAWNIKKNTLKRFAMKDFKGFEHVCQKNGTNQRKIRLTTSAPTICSLPNKRNDTVGIDKCKKDIIGGRAGNTSATYVLHIGVFVAVQDESTMSINVVSSILSTSRPSWLFLIYNQRWDRNEYFLCCYLLSQTNWSRRNHQPRTR
jgi:hypothetical protein